MKEFFEIVLDSLIDSAKILPILLLVYFLIEFFEHRQATKFKKLHFLNKKNSPAIASLFGILPQCGFSIIATDLYQKRRVTVGALIAVYIATSDEALPVMLSQPSSYKWILPLLVTKIAIAIIIGYLSQFVFDLIFNKKSKNNVVLNNQLLKCKAENDKVQNFDNEEIDNRSTEGINKENIHTNNDYLSEQHTHTDEHSNKDNHELDDDIKEPHHGCCHHDIEHKKYNWKHPLLHCLKVILTIFIINVVFGCIIEFGFKGEEKLAEFLTGNTIYALQPMLAMAIGFIPNCASSVVLTELYLIGGLSFGSLIGGLIVNAGLGLILLLKENKRPKENLFIILTLVITSLSFGYLLHYII